MAKSTSANDFMGDRYKYDFSICTLDKGWAQLDTRQDASYYGNWINPLTFELFSYCEGDITHIQCNDEGDFYSTVVRFCNWHKDHGYFIGIDGMCNQQIIDAFTQMGLGDLLH
jgi:hypothetical protein